MRILTVTLLAALATVVGGCDKTSPSPDTAPKTASAQSRPYATVGTTDLVDRYIETWDDDMASELVSRGPDTVSELLKRWDRLDELDRTPVEDLIRKIGPGARAAIPVLIQQLRTGEFFRREGAASCLAAIGPASIPALINVYNGSDLDAAWRAGIALSQIGEPAVASLLPSLNSREESRRRLTMRVLSDMGPGARSAIPRLRQLLKTDTYGNRLDAAKALVNAGDPRTGLDVLVADVRSWNRRTRQAAKPPANSFWSLSFLGQCRPQDVGPIVDVLAETLQNPNTERRFFALDNLNRFIDSDKAQAAMLEMIRKDSEPSNRERAAYDLGCWAERHALHDEKAAIQELEAVVQHERNADVRAAARDVLASINTRRIVATSANEQEAVARLKAERQKPDGQPVHLVEITVDKNGRCTIKGMR